MTEAVGTAANAAKYSSSTLCSLIGGEDVECVTMQLFYHNKLYATSKCMGMIDGATKSHEIESPSTITSCMQLPNVWV